VCAYLCKVEVSVASRRKLMMARANSAAVLPTREVERL